MPEPLPQLYAIAHAGLCRAAFVTGKTVDDGQPITTGDARRALAAAADSLAHPDAADYGPQPDPADVLAFLRRLEADGMVTRIGREWVLDLDAAPF
jgi:hypothetical protein